MITEKDFGYIFLSSLNFSNLKKVDIIIEEVGGAENVISADPNKLKNILTEKELEKFKIGQAEFNKKDIANAFARRQIYVITRESNLYPNKLFGLSNAPYILYAVGNLELLNTKCIAIVGTRSPSEYGIKATNLLSKELAQNDITIVSGMAYGVDKLAHQGALSVNGNTIAVLGGGFDHIYPTANINLFTDIRNKGLVLTEYFPSISPTNYTFPMRNRIISALSDGVLITEAGQKSGSLYTKDYAEELGIDIYAVPGSIFSEKSVIPNQLIKSGNAFPVINVDDILVNLNIISKPSKKSKIIQLSIDEQTICSALKDKSLTIDELQEQTNLPQKTLYTCLTSLEIREIITKLVGGFYSLN